MAQFKHSLQLAQLKRLDPAAARQAKQLLDANDQTNADALIIRAMKTALKRLSQPQPRIVDLADLLHLFQARLPDAPAPGKERKLAVTNHGPVSIHRPRNENRLRLVIRTQSGPISSKFLARWGLDDQHISGRQGCWKMVDGAELKFQEWVRAVQR